MSKFAHYLPLIPFLPLAGFLINGLFGRYLDRRIVAGIACGTLAFSFALSLCAFFILLGKNGGLEYVMYNWFTVGDLSLNFGFLADNLTAIMLLVVTGVGLLIHIYSVGYMWEDAGFARYFAYLNLFCFSMLVLVMADNLVLMFVGWEGVGLCSYLLIGYWFTDPAKAKAGMKAFVTNRIGDLAVLLGMFMIVGITTYCSGKPTLDIMGINGLATLAATGAEQFKPLVDHAWIIGLFLFIGACGKSAQLPLHVWLPDAMAGPTPVSALIHAATMVTAGVFMIIRLGPLFTLSPMAGAIISLVGAGTALFAALVALSQTDIKKVLAYSTVSQLGFMFIAAGAGSVYPVAYVAALFHLVTHAFFKALLFMGSGSVIHAMHHAYPKEAEAFHQDVRNMGGLHRKMPITFITFLAGSVALAGIIGFAGFWSKDEILHAVFSAGTRGSDLIVPMYLIAGVLGLITALLTAFYVGRLFVLSFLGEHRGTAEGYKHLHESSAIMWVPLVILAVLSLIGGLINLPGTEDSGILGHGLENYIMGAGQTDSSALAIRFSDDPHAHGAVHAPAAVGHGEAAVPAPPSTWASVYSFLFGQMEVFGLILMLVSTLIGLGGAYWAYLWYTTKREAMAAKYAANPNWQKLTALSYAKFYVDEFYEKAILKPVYNFASLLFILVDRLLIDISLFVFAQVVYYGSVVSRRVQTGLLSFYAMSFIVGVLLILGIMLSQVVFVLP